MPNFIGEQKWEALRKRLHSVQKSDVVGIDDMTLEQLLEAEKKFLAWYPITNSPEKETKHHIYKTYLKPRIEKLLREQEGKQPMLGL